jgi:hypothetical protein
VWSSSASRTSASSVVSRIALLLPDRVDWDIASSPVCVGIVVDAGDLPANALPHGTY